MLFGFGGEGEENSRVVEESMEGVLLREERLRGFAYRRNAAQVELHVLRLLPGLLLQLLDGPPRFVLAPRCHVDLRVVLQELLDDLVANAGVTPCSQVNARSRKERTSTHR